MQLSGRVALSPGVDVYDLDGDETSAETIDQIHASGARAVCYLNAGARETWREDADQIPAAAIGAPMDGWPDERWLDIRRRDDLRPVMEKRIATCADKGFDAIDPDNMNGYENDSGFPLTPRDAAAYLHMVAQTAHSHGLSVGLKNASELIALAPDAMDFAVVEECLQFDECHRYAPLASRGLAVVDLEYTGTAQQVCGRVPEGFSVLLADRALDGPTRAC